MEHLDFFTVGEIPATSRVVDRLADILFASDEILGILQRFPADDSTSTAVERSVRHVYEEVNALMKRLVS